MALLPAVGGAPVVVVVVVVEVSSAEFNSVQLNADDVCLLLENDEISIEGD